MKMSFWSIEGIIISYKNASVWKGGGYWSILVPHKLDSQAQLLFSFLLIILMGLKMYLEVHHLVDVWGVMKWKPAGIYCFLVTLIVEGLPLCSFNM